MMFLGAILPLLLIIFMIYAVVSASSRKSSSRGGWLQGTKLKIVLVGYISILLLSVVLFVFIPFTTIAENSEGESIHHYDTAIYEGRLDDIKDEIIVRERFEYEYDEDLLYLDVDIDNFFRNVYVERVPDSNTIEVVDYFQPGKYYDHDLNKEVPALGATLLGNRLTLEPPHSISINFASIKKEFTINQFTNEDWRDHRSPYDFYGTSAIYIRVPQELELINEMDDVNIHFVD